MWLKNIKCATTNNKKWIYKTQVATAAHLRSIQENQSTEVTTETNDDDDDELPNDLQCILDVLRSLQDFVQGQHGWFDRVMAMLRRLQDMRAACDDIELDFLQRQCRAAVDALRAVYLAIIVYDIQNIVSKHSRQFIEKNISFYF